MQGDVYLQKGLGVFGGKRGCGSKPFASRLSRFSEVFVSSTVISFLSLLDFGRSRFSVVFLSCIIIGFLSLSDFGRSRSSAVFVSSIILCFLSLSDFGRRLCYPIPVFGLYRDQSSQPLGLWSAAGRCGNLFVG